MTQSKIQIAREINEAKLSHSESHRLWHERTGLSTAAFYRALQRDALQRGSWVDPAEDTPLKIGPVVQMVSTKKSHCRRFWHWMWRVLSGRAA